ncbi:pyridoxal-phosphate-dependent aminotransferase family protein [Candidatus Marithrix sp. Canyon 246]|uniref:pyridoxal-phosphate-dependent aminotransferase family protein n=1 Tax=Candidatus Marithrix sp. Canyon 246 TaxID=1827136 RepID=UPI000849F5BD|nr:aminotransferase class V-fold PLP-dependent enzyme [Candidatus Marithrix sp. Canyon 246]
MEKYLLFTPGPVNVAKNVQMAICKEDICHRETDFDCLLQSIENKLLKLFEIKTIAYYRAVVITGSGTAANESILSSVVGNKNILILSNGEFGERLFNISKIHNKNTFLLEFAWAESLDLEKIEAYLQKHQIDIVAMVHHETSSGMLNPLEKIGALAKANGAMFIVDCVSSAGAEVIDMEKCNIAFCSSSSSKAIGSYSGLSFVVGKTEEFEKLKNLPIKTTYLNLYKFYEFIKTLSQTPNTPAIHLFFALEQALINILNEGVSNRYANIRRKANILRQGMLNLGLKFVIDQTKMCSVLTTVYIPSHINVNIFRQKLRNKSIIIYEGKGCFKNRVFQVGNIGELSFDDIQFFLDTQREVLQSFNHTETKTIVSIKKENLNSQLMDCQN